MRPATWLERGILIVASGSLFHTGHLQDIIGLALFVLAIGLHWFRVRGRDSTVPPATGGAA